MLLVAVSEAAGFREVREYRAPANGEECGFERERIPYGSPDVELLAKPRR
jgi:hypothetical protein